jgi:hypothetical protein
MGNTVQTGALLKNVTHQVTQPTAAQIETELSKLSAFGIVEALDVSVCLIIYKTKAGGGLELFKSRCGKGVISNKRTGGHNNEGEQEEEGGAGEEKEEDDDDDDEEEEEGGGGEREAGEEEGGAGEEGREKSKQLEFEDKRSSKSAKLCNKMRQTNPSMIKLIEFSHRSDRQYDLQHRGEQVHSGRSSHEQGDWNPIRHTVVRARRRTSTVGDRH